MSYLDLGRDQWAEDGVFSRSECQECGVSFFSDGPRLCEQCRRHVSTVGLSYEDNGGDPEVDDWEDRLRREDEWWRDKEEE